jgi:hypothetical protein
LGRSSINDCHDIVLTHDDEILVIDFDLRPDVFAEEHAIAHFDVERAGLPAVQLCSAKTRSRAPEQDGRFEYGMIREC